MIHGRLFGDNDHDAIASLHPAAHRFDTTVKAIAAEPWKSELWLPEPFEPRYAYPLIVWLHDDDQDELCDARVADAAAAQNLIVMSVRGLYRSDDVYRWTDEDGQIDGTKVWRAIAEELSELPPELRIHEERMFVAGRGAGAIAAWRAWISHHDQLAGAALVMPPHSPDSDALRDAAVRAQQQPALSGRLWIGGHAVTSWRPAARTAYAMGAEVSLDPTAVSDEQIGRSLDRWTMRALPTAAFA